MRHFDLYEVRALCAFCLAAVGRFLLYADGSGGAEHHAAEIESTWLSELATGDDNDYGARHPEHRHHAIS